MVGAAKVDSGPSGMAQAEQLGRVHAAGGRHHVVRACHQVRDGIDACAMRHRRRVDDTVFGRYGIDIDEIGQAHGHQVAVAEHHALGPAGRAAGVEQPGEFAAIAVFYRHRPVVIGCSQQRIGFVRLHVDLPLQAGQVIGRNVGGHEGPARAGVADDPFHFPGMQLRIDRDDRQASPPCRPHDFQVARMIAHEENDTVAAHQAGLAHPRGEAGAARSPLPVICMRHGAVVDGGAFGRDARLARQQMCKAHDVSPGSL